MASKNASQQSQGFQGQSSVYTSKDWQSESVTNTKINSSSAGNQDDQGDNNSQKSGPLIQSVENTNKSVLRQNQNDSNDFLKTPQDV